MPQTFFIARQPIFDQNENLWGFELLFRNGLSANYAEIDDPESASVAVASCGFLHSRLRDFLRTPTIRGSVA